MSKRRRFAVPGYVAAGALLAGCATFSDDGGFRDVATATRERLNQEVQWPRTEAEQETVTARVRALLEKPLDADAAVQIALLNNRGLQASFAQLGIAEADLVRAGRLPNPAISVTNLHGESERGVHFDLSSVLALPFASRIEDKRFAQTKLAIAGDVLSLAAQTRRAYFTAVAARETAVYMEQVKLAAEASAELAQRMARTGNWSNLEQAREQVFYAEATAQLARARQAALAAREQLTRLLGLWGQDIQFQLPERLPALPELPQERAGAEQTAIMRRLDVLMARREVESLADSLGLTKATRFVNVLEVGYLNNSEAGTGFEVRFELPLFDFGQARVVKAEAIYLQAFNRAAEIAINARSEAREAYAGYRTAYDIAKHYRDEIVPLRKKISEENLLRYNGMLISVFELLADAREQVRTVNSYIEALREFWFADSELEMTLTGKSPGAIATVRSTLPLAERSGH
jgi:outer membrane protein TolC